MPMIEDKLTRERWRGVLLLAASILLTILLLVLCYLIGWNLAATFHGSGGLNS